MWSGEGCGELAGVRWGPGVGGGRGGAKREGGEDRSVAVENAKSRDKPRTTRRLPTAWHTYLALPVQRDQSGWKPKHTFIQL